MNSILKLFLFTLVIFQSISTYSQVTLTEIKSVEEKIVLRPEPYDSLKDWEYHSKNIDYKQYIGLKAYLPPFDNPEIGTVEKKSGGASWNETALIKGDIPFLFSKKPLSINLDSLRPTLNYNTDIYKWDTVGFCNKVLTYVYYPIPLWENKYDQHPTIYNSKNIGDKYFTIIDIIYGVKLKDLSKTLKADFDEAMRNYSEKDTYYDEYENDYYNENILFVLKNELSGDTVYCNNILKLILVPYFVKQKELFQNKSLIYIGYRNFKSYDTRFIQQIENDIGIQENKFKEVVVMSGSKWVCSEVTLTKVGIENYRPEVTLGDDFKPEYKMVYVLKNDKDEQIVLTDIEYFEDEQQYLKIKADKQLQQEHLLARQKQEEQVRKEIKRKAFEKREKECVLLFGQQNGELIAQGKVKIGMTKEMCKSAWGTPLWTNKTTTVNETYEDWYYWLGYSLHFNSGILSRIEE